MFKKFKNDTTYIKEVASLLKDKISGKIVKQDLKPLTAVGENFGSEILKLDVTVEQNGQQETLHAVAKLIPPTEMQMKIFNTQVTFKNEMAFYDKIVPAIEEFQREQKISQIADYFPQLYGARTTLKANSDVVDEDAVIVLENLKISGYDNIEKSEGFDLESTKLVLRTLANFQATAVSLRAKKPDIFSSHVQPYLTEWKASYHPMDFDELLKENPNTIPLIPKVHNLIATAIKDRNKKIKQPWATITLNDLWINNILLKYQDSQIDGIKLVDFQGIDYGSPATDVIFFLFSSVNTSLLKSSLNELLQYYYDQFIGTLQEFKLDVKEFTYQSFEEELKMEGFFQIFHTLFMLNVIFGRTYIDGLPGTSTLKFKEKIWFVVEEAARRKWI